MRDLSDRIDSVGKKIFNLRNEIIGELVKFVDKYGVERNGEKMLSISSEARDIISLPTMLCCDNRHTDSYCYADIDSMSFSLHHTGTHSLCFDTEYDSVNAMWMTINELIDIYDSLYRVEELTDELDISDGIISEKI